MGDSRYRSQAWRDYLERYTRLFYAWFRRWGVDPQIMEDALQETMLRVLGNMKSFERQREGSFRAWLKTVAHSSWKELVSDSKRQLGQRDADPVLASQWIYNQSQLSEESLLMLFEEWATEEVLNLACSRVRRRVDPETWETYLRVTLENQSVESVIAQAGIPAGKVYSRLFRVRRMLEEEITDIDGTGA